jgi:hypothetical protein
MSVDHEDLGTLGGMLQLGAQYIAEQDEPNDQVTIPLQGVDSEPAWQAGAASTASRRETGC